MAAGLPKEVFLSHSDHDRAFVESLADVLRRHGVPFWYSRAHIKGAQQWHDEIGAALHRCDWFAVILSPQSVNSVWVKRELIYALKPERFENRIIPIAYQPSDYEALSWTLSAFQMVDFTHSLEEGCRDLLRMWGMGYRDKVSAP
ncbi:MAG: toll/interleukin-1 receptor domain-containing protein [Pyrinomonadaceae bacterium]